MIRRAIEMLQTVQLRLYRRRLRRALEAEDVATLRRILKPHIPDPVILEITMHKARLANPDCDTRLRIQSADWLANHGYKGYNNVDPFAEALRLQRSLEGKT